MNVDSFCCSADGASVLGHSITSPTILQELKVSYSSLLKFAVNDEMRLDIVVSAIKLEHEDALPTPISEDLLLKAKEIAKGNPGFDYSDLEQGELRLSSIQGLFAIDLPSSKVRNANFLVAAGAVDDVNTSSSEKGIRGYRQAQSKKPLSKGSNQEKRRKHFKKFKVENSNVKFYTHRRETRKSLVSYQP